MLCQRASNFVNFYLKIRKNLSLILELQISVMLFFPLTFFSKLFSFFDIVHTTVF